MVHIHRNGGYKPKVKFSRMPDEKSEAAIVPLTIETTQLDAGKGRYFNQAQRGGTCRCMPKLGQSHP
jgi:hypothetical protein